MSLDVRWAGFRFVAMAVACATAALQVARAHAATPEGTEELIAQGVQLRRQHQDEAALDAFRRAYDIDRSGRTLAQIALAEQALGRWIDAESDLGVALRPDDDPWIERNRDALGEALADVRGHIGQLDLEANVAGAELFVDDRAVGTLPLKSLKLVAKKVILEVRASGYVPTRLEIQVPPGAALRERVELNRLVAPVDPPKPAVDPGSFKTPIAALPLVQEGPARRTMAFVMLGSGGSLLVAGVGAQILREQAAGRYNDDQRCFFGSQTRDQRCGQDKRDAQTAQTVMILGYAVGGLAVGASVVLLLTAPRGKTSSSIVAVQPAAGGAMFSYAGSF